MEYNITYRKKDKGWQYIISYKESGKWKQKSKQGFGTKGLAKVAADKRLDEMKKNFKLQKNLSIEYEEITFKELSKMFIEHISIHNTHSTVTSYKTAINKFKRLNKLRVRNIMPLHIQNCVDSAIKEGLKISTVKKYTSLIKTIFNYAIDQHKIITQSPVYKIKFPEEKGKNKIKALTMAQYINLLSNLKNPSHYIATAIAGKAGLRVGEIVGLTWGCIDLKNKTIEVNKQWKQLENKVWGFGATKTKNSNRIVPIPSSLVSDLEKYKKNNPTDIHNRVVLYQNTSSLCSVIRKNYIRLGYNNSIHDMRHTYATNLVAHGEDFQSVANLLGNTAKEVMETYSHVTEEMKERTATLIENIYYF